MAIINFDFPRIPCLTGFGNLTMYNWKMSQWNRPPLLVIPESRRKHWGNSFAQWNNHPQTKAETTHTLKGWISGAGSGRGILRRNIRLLYAATIKPQAKKSYWLELLRQGGDPRAPQAHHTITNYWHKGQGNAIACYVDVYVMDCWPWQWWDTVRQLIRKQ